MTRDGQRRIGEGSGWARTNSGTGAGRLGLIVVLALLGLAAFAVGCAGTGGEATVSGEAAAAVETLDEAARAEANALAERAAGIFGTLPASVEHPDDPSTPERIALGRMLYYDKRLSKNHDIACNSCHMLDRFGVDGEPTSPGHKGVRGDRNSPSVYNAAFHVAQFWDGRAADVEAQSKGPPLNPIEMALPSEAFAEQVLASIPGYVDAFGAAFPEDEQPISYDNMARAIGAFERELMTPGRFDAFLGGDLAALSADEQRGLNTFLAVGCATCHLGPGVGGSLYRKLGQIFPYETEDVGREKLTGQATDRHVFKVPSLRNVAETGPYLHDGSIATLEEMIGIMGYHQLAQTLDDAQVADLAAFLGSLTGEVDTAFVAEPELPASGPNTPAPDPS